MVQPSNHRCVPPPQLPPPPPTGPHPAGRPAGMCARGGGRGRGSAAGDGHHRLVLLPVPLHEEGEVLPGPRLAGNGPGSGSGPPAAVGSGP